MNVVLPTRTYQLSFEHRPHYLYAHLSCEEISFEIAKEYWVEILKMLHRRKYTRLLVEKDIPNSLRAHEVFTLITELAHSGCTRVRFAIFDHHYDVQRNGFEQLVATTRGLQVKITDNFADAEKWLDYADADLVHREEIKTMSVKTGPS